jgi:hypothetical protein
MGRVQSEQLLTSDWDRPSVTNDAKLLYGLDEPDQMRIGGSARYMGIYGLDSGLTHFPMQLDAYAAADLGTLKAGVSLGYTSLDANSPHGRAAYLFKDDGEGGSNVVSRTHWIGADIGRRWLLRLGRLNLPFGLRISEHTAFVRDATKTDRESDQQHGLALAYSGGSWRGEGMFVAGNFQIGPDDYRERGFVGFAEYALDRQTAVGLTTQVLQSAKSLLTGRQSRTIRHAHGATLRYVPFDPMVLMAELDILKTTGYGMGYTAFVNADLEFLRGLHVGATGEVLDRGKQDGAGGDGETGYGKMTYAAWATLQWFFYTHWDFRVDAGLRDQAETTVQGQMHFYF